MADPIDDVLARLREPDCATRVTFVNGCTCDLAPVVAHIASLTERLAAAEREGERERMRSPVVRATLRLIRYTAYTQCDRLPSPAPQLGCKCKSCDLWRAVEQLRKAVAEARHA